MSKVITRTKINKLDFRERNYYHNSIWSDLVVSPQIIINELSSCEEIKEKYSEKYAYILNDYSKELKVIKIIEGKPDFAFTESTKEIQQKILDIYNEIKIDFTLIATINPFHVYDLYFNTNYMLFSDLRSFLDKENTPKVIKYGKIKNLNLENLFDTQGQFLLKVNSLMINKIGGKIHPLILINTKEKQKALSFPNQDNPYLPNTISFKKIKRAIISSNNKKGIERLTQQEKRILSIIILSVNSIDFSSEDINFPFLKQKSDFVNINNKINNFIEKNSEIITGIKKAKLFYTGPLDSKILDKHIKKIFRLCLQRKLLKKQKVVSNKC